MALLGTETTQTCTEAKEQEADTWNAIGMGLNTSKCGKFVEALQTPQSEPVKLSKGTLLRPLTLQRNV